MPAALAMIVLPVVAAALPAAAPAAAPLGPGVAGGRAVDARAETARTVASAPVLPSGPLAWSPLDLFGGEVTSVAVDPADARVVYAGTRDAGVFKSTDGAATWCAARAGLTFYPIRSLLVDPARSATIWAGTDYDGVWKSIDGGATWGRAGASSTPGSMIVFNLAVDPRDASVAYAACAGGIALSIGGVWKTSDGGATWTQADAGIPRYVGSATYTSGVFAFALDAAHPDSLIAGTVLQGIFRSDDAGATWSPVNEGVPFRYGSTDTLEEINALAFDPHHGARPAAVIGGRYFVRDAGTWTQRSGPADRLGFLPSDLAFHATLADEVFTAGGIFGFAKSTDGGASWTAPDGGTGIKKVTCARSSPGRLFAARPDDFDRLGSVAASSDDGEHWTLESTGIVAADVRSVAADPRDPLHLWVGTGGGFVFASHDGGASWTAARDGGYEFQEVYHFGEVTSIVADPHDPTMVSVAAFSGFFQSHDRGAKLYEVEAVNAPNAITVSAATTPSTYYVASANRGVYRSTDGGASWTAVTQGLPTFGGSLNPVLAVEIDPNDADTVWIGTQFGGGILRTTDAGEHWEPRGLTAENFVEAISVRPGNGQEVLAGAGFSSGKILKSVDGGATWRTTLSGIGFVKALIREPGSPDVVYAGSEGFGVLRSTDGGDTWEDATGAIFYPLVYALALTADVPPRLLAGSHGSGLYAAPLEGVRTRRVRRHLRH